MREVVWVVGVTRYCWAETSFSGVTREGLGSLDDRGTSGTLVV